MSALGLGVAFCLTLTLLPALFRLLPRPRLLPLESGRRAPPARTWYWGSFAVLLLLLPLALQLRFDFSVLALRDPDAESMRALQALQDDGLVTDYSLHVLLDDLASAQHLAGQLETHPLVATATTVDRLVPSHQEDAAERFEPLQTWAAALPVEEADALPGVDDFAVARDYLRAALPKLAAKDRGRAERFLVDGEDLSVEARAGAARQLSEALRRALRDLDERARQKPFGVADLPGELLDPFRGADGRWLLRLQPAIALNDPASVATFVETLAPLVPNYAGRAVIEWGIGRVVVESFQTAALLALVSIGCVLLLVLRSVRDTLLVLFPVVASLLVTFAVAGLVGLSLNMANILVVPLIVGLGVDTGVHIVHRHRQSGSLHDAAGARTRRAVLISALTTLGTFLSLTLSPHRGAASIGLIFLIAISALLCYAYWVLPALLNRLPPTVRRAPEPDP